MSGRRIFSNGVDTTYNNYYNSRVTSNNICPPSLSRPPMTVVQASSSYRHDGEQIRKNCNNGGCIYPYGQYATSPTDSLIVPPVNPIQEDQAVLVYGAITGDTTCNINEINGIEEEGCVDACIGAIDSIHHHEEHLGKPDCRQEFQMEMELLKNYRFKCYECINPCCPANKLALQMIHESRSTKSGTVTTTMTYGSTGTTTTTTTTSRP